MLLAEGCLSDQALPLESYQPGQLGGESVKTEKQLNGWQSAGGQELSAGASYPKDSSSAH